MAKVTLTESETIARLKSTMIAAAEELAAHWPAHCDSEGYGPVNLLRRLEEGIPAQYAYTAGDFAKLQYHNALLLDTLAWAAKQVPELGQSLQFRVALMKVTGDCK